MPIASETIARQLSQRAHVGIENELSGYSLVLLQRIGTGWRRCDIRYGMRAAVSEGKSPVHKIPLSEIQVEGGNNGKTGIPEHITGPLRPQTLSFDHMRQALGILRNWLRTTVQCAHPYATHEGFEYHKLSSVLENYNRDIDFLARSSGDKRWKRYRMHAADPFYATWVVGLNKGKDVNAMETQSNLEIPFRAIGQQSGGTDLGDQFGPRNKGYFFACRKYAQELTQAKFAARRRELMGKKPGETVKLERLNSLFTLYYFAVVMHALNSRPSQLKGALAELKQNGKIQSHETEENRATKNKNQWGLLPKVRWTELFDKAISEVDRKILNEHFNNGVKWQALKNEMTTHLLKIDASLDAGFVAGMHESIIKAHSVGLSSTGKPLPVESLPGTKTVHYQQKDALGNIVKEWDEEKNVSEPMIVFEFRHGGHDHSKFNIQYLGKPEMKLSSQLLVALDGLQGYA